MVRAVLAKAEQQRRQHAAEDLIRLQAAALQAAANAIVITDRAGTIVGFKVHDDSDAALVIFARTNGSPIPAGSSGRLNGGEDFVIGYDGQAFIKGLERRVENGGSIDKSASVASFFVSRVDSKVDKALRYVQFTISATARYAPGVAATAATPAAPGPKAKG